MNNGGTLGASYNETVRKSALLSKENIRGRLKLCHTPRPSVAGLAPNIDGFQKVNSPRMLLLRGNPVHAEPKM